MQTPFGVIYTTNISPDPSHGIGRWSLAAFVRAMREGIDREGQYLYPAFPYDHFRLVTDQDLAALYAFLMSRAPAATATPPTALRFPFNLRPSICLMHEPCTWLESLLRQVGVASGWKEARASSLRGGKSVQARGRSAPLGLAGPDTN